ncbi:hypothetical protein [Flavilitoribacter nigricans]|uniref:Outer membrane protein beta-barrel domain-containing protein n=1 Tax=Flavilitoribacter nigricans (strain ATCC 23147 / DSM 23189 / NBRC 102662 / NCIMB 1420 / SS-2) TaxID=1122177 RepID=A0A2D0NC75_FLAN2|nr:hypothetical protein [Flavilitoribacter nigricans]PHN05789.1 hypothetical protein CRP01_15055 [Flavilitoribacter nigricans DSM 23189 = NBRC 102662]
MKKNSYLIILALLCSTGLMAQHETLFNRARVVGGFGAPILEMGINNNLNTSVGGGGGIVINSFFLGGYGLASVDFEELFDNGEVEVLNIGHGGFWLGGTLRPYKILHLYASTRLGWGAVNVDLQDNNQRYSDIDKIFVATPELGIELNLTRWFRIAGTAGYRWVNGTSENRGYTDDDFSGAVASVALRFGWFGSKRW